MHGILFQAKRAHLSGVAWGRRILEVVGSVLDDDEQPVQLITPARFDLLYAIYSSGRDCDDPERRFTSTQSHVRRILGLHVSTVSKMITRLIQLGILCEGLFWESDKRRRVVTITEFGIELLRRARGEVFGKRRIADDLLDHTWGSERMPRSRRRWRLHAALFSLFATVKALARRLGDWSEGLYQPRRNGTADRQSPNHAYVRQCLKPFERFYSPHVRRRPPRAGEPAIDLLI